jgi:hypothetical protein
MQMDAVPFRDAKRFRLKAGLRTALFIFFQGVSQIAVLGSLTARRSAAMAYAYPVIANGRLYIRDLGTLWDYDIKTIR